MTSDSASNIKTDIKIDIKIDIKEIMELLPHRYPFLLVDRVLEYKTNDSIKCLKNVTINENFFCGHFPGMPVMPGVLIIEACAQAAAILAFQTMKDKGESVEDGIFLFAGIDKARFKKPVVPGDQLIISVSVDASKRAIWKTSATVTVGDKIVCQASLLAAFTKKDVNQRG
jgi:3-hydroxyacyl-[acyl-carrier-protein] dehydratase